MAMSSILMAVTAKSVKSAVRNPVDMTAITPAMRVNGTPTNFPGLSVASARAVHDGWFIFRCRVMLAVEHIC